MGTASTEHTTTLFAVTTDLTTEAPTISTEVTTSQAPTEIITTTNTATFSETSMASVDTTETPMEPTVTDPTYKLIACFEDCIKHYGCQAYEGRLPRNHMFQDSNYRQFLG